MLSSSARIAAPQRSRDPCRLVVSRASNRSAPSRPGALRTIHHAMTAAASAKTVPVVTKMAMSSSAYVAGSTPGARGDCMARHHTQSPTAR